MTSLSPTSIQIEGLAPGGPTNLALDEAELFLEFKRQRAEKMEQERLEQARQSQLQLAEQEAERQRLIEMAQEEAAAKLAAANAERARYAGVQLGAAMVLLVQTLRDSVWDKPMPPCYFSRSPPFSDNEISELAKFTIHELNLLESARSRGDNKGYEHPAYARLSIEELKELAMEPNKMACIERYNAPHLEGEAELKRCQTCYDSIPQLLSTALQLGFSMVTVPNANSTTNWALTRSNQSSPLTEEQQDQLRKAIQDVRESGGGMVRCA